MKGDQKAPAGTATRASTSDPLPSGDVGKLHLQRFPTSPSPQVFEIPHHSHTFHLIRQRVAWSAGQMGSGPTDRAANAHPRPYNGRMTFIPDFDLSMFQRLNPITDGRYHVRVLDNTHFAFLRDLSFETEEEARAAAIEVCDKENNCGVVVTPDGRIVGTFFMHTP